MLNELSTAFASLVEQFSPSVVQVVGSHRPASGLVFSDDHVVTTIRVVGRDEHPTVRRHDGEQFQGDLVGIDPATRIALIKAAGLGGAAPTPAAGARVGTIAIAVARSWSNNITATAGLVSVIGGPLATGRRTALEQVIRTSAPMHEGFAGGALVGTDGALLGLATAASIRGLGVVIPASIAWTAATSLLHHGNRKRGYIGIAAQPVRVPQRQAPSSGTRDALLVVGVKDESPAAEAGLLVGDLVLAVDAQPVSSPDDLIDLLAGDRVGHPVTLDISRGGQPLGVSVRVRERG